MKSTHIIIIALLLFLIVYIYVNVGQFAEKAADLCMRKIENAAERKIGRTLNKLEAAGINTTEFRRYIEGYSPDESDLEANGLAPVGEGWPDASTEGRPWVLG